MSYSDDREASDSDKDVVEKKRKKNTNNGGYASGNGASSTKENGDYSTPSSSKVRKASTSAYDTTNTRRNDINHALQFPPQPKLVYIGVYKD